MKSAAIALLLLPALAPAQLKINIPGSSGAGAGDQVITESDTSKSIECHHETILLRGNKDTVNITGECKSVHVIGDGNTVNIERADGIVVSGNGNTVRYRYPNAGVSVPGKDNHVSVARTDQ